MPALATLTLVWLGAQKPDAAATAALERYARERAVKLEEPRREPPVDTASAELAERCEAWLEQARDQIQAGDDEGALGLLAQLEHALRQHPELVQASWLMAERYRLEARLARHAAPDQALHLEHLAEVTEGARALAFGETRGAARAPAPKVQVTLVIHGARRHEVYWDGALAGNHIATMPGEHHLVVFRGARVAWAGWVSALTSGSIDVWVPDAPACSADDFAGVLQDSATHFIVPSGIRCGAWAVAGPGAAPGTVAIALCAVDNCQPIAVLSDPLAVAPNPDERAPGKSFLPPWAAWTLAGVGVTAVTSIVLWRAGAFDRAPESKLFYDGSHL